MPRQFLSKLLRRQLQRLPAAARGVVADSLQALSESSLASLSSASRAQHDLSSKRPSMEAGLWQLARRGFRPTHVIDVGACWGAWSLLALEVFPQAQVFAIEPRESERPALEKAVQQSGGRMVTSNHLVGPEPRSDVPFQELHGGSGSTVLHEESNVPRTVVLRSMTTLDALVQDGPFAGAQLLKLDVQGYELEVLRGARQLLPSVEVVVMEVATWPYNRGAPLLHEVLPRMREWGFVVLDVASVIRRPQDDVLLQLDLVLAREDGPLRRDVTTYY